MEPYGLAPALAAVGLARSTWYYHRTQKVAYESKYAHLRSFLEEIARKHPEYGYRRTTRELREGFGVIVNTKVVRHLHRLWDLAILRCTQIPRPSGIRRIIREAKGRVNLVASLREIRPFEVLYTDFTEIRYAGGERKAYLMPIIDHASKVVYGWALAERANVTLALRAWQRARQTLRSFGVSPRGLIMHHDQDPVYTSYAWIGRLLHGERVRVSFALQGARDNPWMESFHSRFKGEWKSLFLDARSIEELEKIVADRIHYYNAERRHSSIGYLSPLNFIRQWMPNTA